jgi:hypothetical protein
MYNKDVASKFSKHQSTCYNVQIQTHKHVHDSNLLNLFLPLLGKLGQKWEE